MIIGEAGQAARALWGDVFENSGRVYGGGGKGGQFTMDPEELSAVIGQWEDLLDKITEDGQKITGMTTTLGIAPGKDPASGSYADTTMASLSALQQQNDSMRKYAQAYIKKLKEAQTKTVSTDHGMSETFKSSQA
ncbi:hypothetical protein [Amycolatopsis australiensis]|uniref:PE family protein n=1 Tax=Amycolatopsis australiensis TaxID=546364 RepID=A0A1K1SCC1_9PSEU|nr:hypothetical protein [Amycolatopsis australiensis]SFW81756.1 hypothetical protein SAMN04489730_5267 [Amycolatopsis australiensis]